MPYSNAEQISPIMSEVLRIRPRRMLDVGCGLGVYGLLSRIQLDLYFDEQFHKKIFRDYRPQQVAWETTIDAIEGFADYADYIPQWVYNNLIFEDARTALPKVPDGRYDLSLALAIIEHLSKKDGLEFVRQLQRISRVVILSVPKQVRPQSVPGNDFETHRSQWSKEDFLELGFSKFLPHSGAWIPVYDPSLPAYQETENKDLFGTPENPSFAMQNKLALSLDRLSDKADEIIKMQDFMLKLLSLKYRIKLFLMKFRLSG